MGTIFSLPCLGSGRDNTVSDQSTTAHESRLTTVNAELPRVNQAQTDMSDPSSNLKADPRHSQETLTQVAKEVDYDQAHTIELPQKKILMLSSTSFAERFFQASEKYSRFCFGCDPSEQVFKDWGLPNTIEGLKQFCRICIDAAVGHVGIVKPQVAFFERFGHQGLKCLADLITEMRANGILVIADAKRGDIGSVAAAYGEAWLGSDSPFNVDALTVHAYLGIDTLKPLFNRANETGTAVFVVVKSSNPEGVSLQGALDLGHPVSRRLGEHIAELNKEIAVDSDVGPIGAVVGATLGANGYETVKVMPNAIFLVPGIGAQGASVEQSNEVFQDAHPRAILCASRSVLSHGPSVSALRTSLDDMRTEVVNNTGNRPLGT